MAATIRLVLIAILVATPLVGYPAIVDGATLGSEQGSGLAGGACALRVCPAPGFTLPGLRLERHVARERALRARAPSREVPNTLTPATRFALMVASGRAHSEAFAQRNPSNATPIAAGSFVYTVTNTTDSGPGSLREGILQANAHGGRATIRFAIPGSGIQTISPVSNLPYVTVSAANDGTTQPGYSGTPLIQLDGGVASSRCGTGCAITALVLQAGTSSVQGLQISDWSGDAVDLGPGGDDVVRGNDIVSNRGGGVVVDSGSTQDEIGGTTPAARNVISGNFVGVVVGGNASRVRGNYIGTDASGAGRFGNGGGGVEITGSGDLVGGDDPGARNVISDNGSGVFPGGDGVDIVFAQAIGNRVEGNYIGTDVTGSKALGNAAEGIVIGGGATNNVVGGDVRGAGNLISSNTVDGVHLTDSGTTDNRVEGNYIGTDAGGAVAMGNGGAGVFISSGAANTTVGGDDATARNLIAANGAAYFSGAVDIAGMGTNGNEVEGNYIGTDVSGRSAIGNAYAGVFIEAGANANGVGGDNPGARNLISGNGTQIPAAGVDVASSSNRVEGNYIGTDATGTGALANSASGVLIETGATGNTVGGGASGGVNLISGNITDGVDVNATGNRVQGNYIGTDASGTKPLGNGGVGASVCCAAKVGGGHVAARNLISGNVGDGLDLGDGVLVEGNYIGTDASGSHALWNGGSGLAIGGTANTVGGGDPAMRNLIEADGAMVAFSQDVAVVGSGNRILGNYIGIDATGTVALGNGPAVFIQGNNNVVGGDRSVDRNVIGSSRYFGFGVDLSGSRNQIKGNYVGTDVTGTQSLGFGDGVQVEGAYNTVGGNNSGARNLISGNGDGVVMTGKGNAVTGNYIGTDASGTKSLGNGGTGVFIWAGATGNTVGGSSRHARNIISANRIGVEMTFSGTEGNLVEGNYIGTDASGVVALGNVDDGVLINYDASRNVVGGTVSGTANVIAHNGGGVHVDGSRALGNAIEGNSIFSNGGAGIVLSAGGNGSEPAPTVTTVARHSESTTISGAVASGRHRVEVFADPSCADPEGRQFLGFVDTGGGTWSLTVEATLASGQGVTATSTADSTSDTSQFSACIQS